MVVAFKKTYTIELLIYAILVCFVAACDQPVERTKSVVQDKEEINFPTIQDTFNLQGKTKSIDLFLLSNYHPIYIGKDTNVVTVDYQIQQFYPTPPSVEIIGEELIATESENKIKYRKLYETYFEEYPASKYTYWDSARVEIIIDTTQKVKSLGRTKRDRIEHIFEAYPVLIRNSSETNVSIGYGSHIPLILEFLHNDNWIHLEYMYFYPCGSGMNSIILPKDEIIISSLPLMEGDKTQYFRLKLGNSYSNIIQGRLSLNDSLK